MKFLGKCRTPLQAIKAHCARCAGSCEGVRACTDTSCPLHPCRQGRVPKGSKALSAIKAYCHEYCLPDGAAEVRTCSACETCNGGEACELWPFRMEKSPNFSARTRQDRSNRAKKQPRTAAGDGRFAPQNRSK